MQNQVYTQPYQPYYPQNTTPASSVGAVNIQIFNPTANPQQGFYQPTPCNPYPCNYNNMSVAQPSPSYSNSTLPIENATKAMANNTDTNGVAAQNQTENAENADSKENKPKVTLTDDYIKTLENYLNSQDKKVRLMGAKELLERFKEDETRKSDPALTALLNKTLQDPSETVKFVGLTTLDTGYAAGNDETVEILKQLQSSNSSYGEDAALASQILLKMSGNNSASTNSNMNAAVSQTSDTNLIQQPQTVNLPQNLNSVDSKLPPVDSGILQNGQNLRNLDPQNKEIA